MGELRWILLIIGVIALAAIYAYSRFRMQHSSARSTSEHSRVEPRLDGELSEEQVAGIDSGEPVVAAPEVPAAPAVPEKVVAIRLMSKDRQGFPGDKLVLAMREVGLRHGQFGIFHAHKSETDEVLFSVANLVEPGRFDLAALKETRIPGVSLFLVLPVADASIEAFESMVDTARDLATSLGGELLDEQGSSLSIQRERYIRDEIQQFVREHLMTAPPVGRET